MGIMNFFSWFKKSSSTTQLKDAVEKNVKDDILPGTQLFYDKKLIDHLESDHQSMLGLYGEMAEALEQNNHKQLTLLFTKFSSELRSHLLTENLKLYVYLTHAMANDTESLSIVIELRSEMQQIGRAVNNFLVRYGELPWSEEQIQSFPGEFKQIGEVLVDRIKREEHTLYPLYMHPNAYLQSFVIN